MTRVFDNISSPLDTALREALDSAARTDIAVGFFNLRGWRLLAENVDQFASDEVCARILVGMQELPQDELRRALSVDRERNLVDNATALRMRKVVASQFRQQLTFGFPTAQDEETLRMLSRQLRSGLVKVKLHLAHLLHAKLYLAYRPEDPLLPIIGFVGSSNLTLSGLKVQGELNVDVVDDKAAGQLADWFSDRWKDRLSVDISEELAEIIDESWAREELPSPYLIYLKIAYHLSRDARAGMSEFRIPKDFEPKILSFQAAAVRIAARHLNARGGVVIGDVVGLGKTLMATALARVMQDDDIAPRTLIICPPNLTGMWEWYREEYGLNARVVSMGSVQNELPELRRFPLVIIDESHNLRNREGKRYRAIREYIAANECRCILLSATPYNRSYLDLSAQLRLFVDESADIGVRPERAITSVGETAFIRHHQCGLRTIAAFEHSTHADDWRDLMRLYLVRRTRSFIQENYALEDSETGRPTLTFADGTPFRFPKRVPRTVRVEMPSDDPLGRLYSEEVVDVINALRLPRYGLGDYVQPDAQPPPTPAEATTIEGLGRAGRRLMGFCRTNLFKRLESSGEAFILSVRRHILRNRVVLHALAAGLPVPIGTQEPRLWHAEEDDVDFESMATDPAEDEAASVTSEDENAASAYEEFSTRWRHRFKWLPAHLFSQQLQTDLESDVDALSAVVDEHAPWDQARDSKLAALTELLFQTHAREKVVVFTQFADTAEFLGRCLREAGGAELEVVTGDTSDPTAVARRFSPRSNEIKTSDEVRVLIATDVLSEGQNLQDSSVVVNYDLPWAIVRLIQRAGRVDRIGQESEEIDCYSFEPAEGVEKIIALRERVRRRLRESGEVLGTDEQFFSEESEQTIVDLYNERTGVLDDETDDDVDLSSLAFEIWKGATAGNPALQRQVEALPDVVYSALEVAPSESRGAIAYIRSGMETDAFVRLDQHGKVVSESPLAVLRAAECDPETIPAPAADNHHELVRTAMEHALQTERAAGGGLGRPSGARFRAYERLKRFIDENGDSLLVTDEMKRALEAIYRRPLLDAARDTINRQLRAGINDQGLAELVVALRREDRLVVADDAAEDPEPQLICSVSLT